MKRFEKASELMWVFGIIFVAFGVVVCNKTGLGISMVAAPAFIVSERVPFLSAGVAEYLIQGIKLIILCIIVRKFNWRYLLTFCVSVIYGYTINLFVWILGPVSFDSVGLRFAMLILGDIIVAFGVACFFRTYLPLQVCELFVAEIAAKFKFDINRVKFAYDYSMLAVSLILAFTLFGDAGSFDWSTIFYSDFHSIGPNTLIATLLNAPLIAASGKLIDKIFGASPLFPSLYKTLKRV